MNLSSLTSMRDVGAVRIASVLAILGLVVVLLLAFRRDPLDIRTGTVGKPAPAFDLERLDGERSIAAG